MKDRPILFKGPMVRAILEGRKTQTRRIIAQPFEVHSNGILTRPAKNERFTSYPCPYGEAGGQLWVRERFRLWDSDDCSCLEHCACPRPGTPIYYADTWDNESKWKPSIFMPRSVCRLTLDVVKTAITRLQDITFEDAIAEGLHCLTKDGGRVYKYGIPDLDGLPGNDNQGWHWCEWEVDPTIAFRKLWDSINAVPRPRYKKKVLTHYESFPWDEESADKRSTIRDVPHICIPNPYLWKVEFKPQATKAL